MARRSTSNSKKKTSIKNGKSNKSNQKYRKSEIRHEINSPVIKYLVIRYISTRIS